MIYFGKGIEVIFSNCKFQMMTYTHTHLGKDSEGKPNKLWIENSKDADDKPFRLVVDVATFMNVMWGIEPTWYDNSYHVRGEKEVLRILANFFDQIGLPLFRRPNIEETNTELQDRGIKINIGELFAGLQTKYEVERYGRAQNYEIIDVDNFSDDYSQEIIFCDFIVGCRHN